MSRIEDVQELFVKLNQNSLARQLAKLTSQNASISVSQFSSNALTVNGISNALPIKRTVPLYVTDANNAFILSAEGELLLAFYLARWREEHGYEFSAVYEFIQSLDPRRKQQIECLQVLYRYNLVSKANLDMLMSITDEENFKRTSEALKNLASVQQLNQQTFLATCAHPNKQSLIHAVDQMREKRFERIYRSLGFIAGSLAIGSLICACVSFIVLPAVVAIKLFVGSMFFSLNALVIGSTINKLRSRLPLYYHFAPASKKTINQLLGSRDPESFLRVLGFLRRDMKTPFNIEVLKISSDAEGYFIGLFGRLNISSTEHALFRLFKKKTLGRSVASFALILDASGIFLPEPSINMFRLALTHIDIFLSANFNQLVEHIPNHLKFDFINILENRLNTRGALTVDQFNTIFSRDIGRLLGIQPQERGRGRHAELFHHQNTHLPSVEKSISHSAFTLKKMLAIQPINYSQILGAMQAWLAHTKFDDPAKGVVVRQSFDRLSQLNFTDTQSHVSMQEALVLAWSAVHADHIRGVCSIEDAKNHLINALYEIHTAYGENRPSCSRGSFNKIFEALKCIGVKGVDFIATTNVQLSEDFLSAIQKQLLAVFTQYLNDEQVDLAQQLLQELVDQDIKSATIWAKIRSGVKADMLHHEFYIENSANLPGIANLEQYIDACREHYEFSSEQAEKFKALLNNKLKALKSEPSSAMPISIFKSAPLPNQDNSQYSSRLGASPK